MYGKLYSLALNPQAQGNLLGGSAPLTPALEWGEGDATGERGRAAWLWVLLDAPFCTVLGPRGSPRLLRFCFSVFPKPVGPGAPPFLLPFPCSPPLSLPSYLSVP